MSKGDDRITVQSSNDFSKAAEQLINKTKVIHTSKEDISSGISEVTDYSLTKSQSLGLCKNNIHIVTCNDECKFQAFKHSGGEEVTEFYYKTDESLKSTKGGCILFTVTL